MDSGQPFAASGMTAEIFQQRPSRMSCAGGDSASIKHLQAYVAALTIRNLSPNLIYYFIERMRGRVGCPPQSCRHK
jgi:hypothetical protein